jgi:ABC-2 type transport system ATP-binding protein
MIKVDGLRKSYGPVKALRGVSFEIAEGEIVGLLGPNGAGKTTTIKTLTGYLQPDSGSVFVDGLDVVTETREVQKRIGYLPESAPLYPELTVEEYLKMMAGLRQIPPDEEEAWILEAVESTGLSEHLARPIDELSKGYRQRVGLAQAILHKPRLLILDEPTIGLDPTQIVEIRNLIRRLSAHSTVLFSTHILPEVEALCDRVIMLFSGQIKVDATMSELASTNDALLTVDGQVDGVEKKLQQLDGVDGVEVLEPINGHVIYRVHSEQQADLCPAIYKVAAENGWPVRELRPDSQTLESVFNKMAVAE